MKQTDSGIWVPDTPTIFVKPTEEIILNEKWKECRNFLKLNNGD